MHACMRVIAELHMEGAAGRKSGEEDLGRPLGYLICSLMALIGDPILFNIFKGFQGPTQG